MNTPILCMHKGVTARHVTLDQLEALPDPIRLGPRHVPIRHFDAYQAASQAFQDQGLTIEHAEILVSDEPEAFRSMIGFALKGDAEHWDPGPGSGLTAVILNDNAKRMALDVLAGKITFACDNQMMSGDFNRQRRRHTQGLDLREHVASIIGDYHRVIGNLNRLENSIRSIEYLTDTQAKAVFWDLQESIPKHTVSTAYQLYNSTQLPEAAEDTDGMRLLQSCTRALRNYPNPWQGNTYRTRIGYAVQEGLREHADLVIEGEILEQL